MVVLLLTISLALAWLLLRFVSKALQRGRAGRA
jgi:peptidoglycan/LPS O-acetylase OafA/YrhL